MQGLISHQNANQTNKGGRRYEQPYVIENDLSKINQSETDSLPPYQDVYIGSTNLGAELRKSAGGAVNELKVEDYPDEDMFVYKSQRKNLNLIRPPRFDGLKLVSLNFICSY